MVQLVSALVKRSILIFRSLRTNEKTNEITAIPELIDLLTIDAMGCQQKIATKINSKGGDNILAVNKLFGFKKVNKSIINKKGSGRIKKRTRSVKYEEDFVCNKDNESGLKSLIKIENERTILKTSEAQKQTLYYISSFSKSAVEFYKLVRTHWSIENIFTGF